MSGSILSVWFDGVTYNAKADADFSAETEREIEGIKHSGGTLKKVTLKAAMVSGIDLIVDGTEIINAKAAEAKSGKYSVGFEEEDGTVWDATGFINIETINTAERTMSITMTANTEWELTLP